VKYALENNQQLFIFIQGTAGTGKSTFAKKLTALARSMGLIALGCAATALAAQVYGEIEEFCTAHQLFGIPVVEDSEEIDHEADVPSKYINQVAKLLVLHAARLIMWDENLSNHKQCLSTGFSVTEEFKNKVVILMGDWQQCPPVVRNGDMQDIVAASMINSRYWNDFEVVQFTVNLRLLAAENQSNVSISDEAFFTNQRKYLEMLDIIGSGRKPSPISDTVVELYDENVEIDGSRVIALPLLQCINDTSAALEFLFPGGFDVNLMHTRAILCATNVQVDEWNSIIQDLNINPMHVLPSVDTVKQIDDPHGHLQRMISESVLERFQKSGVPNHRLFLKENDICLVMRNLNKKEGLTTNTRVKILSILPYVIRVCTLHPDNPKSSH
jgi:hypothetical protein